MNNIINEIKTIKIERKVGDDYFMLIYSRKSNKYLKDFLPLFNTEDYIIMKSTNNQRIVSVDEFLDFKHCGYILFKKEKYNLQHIGKWLDIVGDLWGVNYINKPFPPFSPNKIIIK